jgi:hypothetical protein
MPTNAEVNSYLDWLLGFFTESSYVLTPRGVDEGLPWVQEFTFIAKDYIYKSDSLEFANPMEQPRTGDTLFLMGRNLGLRDFDLSFDCRADGGQISFAGADDLKIVVRCPTNAGGVPIAALKDQVIEVRRTSMQEFLRVKVSAVDTDSSQDLKSHNRTLSFMIDP